MTGINTPKHIAPLAVLRIAFGVIMFLSTVRFVVKGWVYSLYIKPIFHFTFYGFEWVKPLGAAGMYMLFAVMALSAIMVTLGLFYRLSVISFFLCFSYVELIDKTTYLNHYYLISIITFLMILVPAHRYFSIDVIRKPQLALSHVPAWTINIFKLQLVIVYFFAGISKLNHDWLIDAMPLKIWLPSFGQLPLIGAVFNHVWVAYAFSWFGAIFDLLIGFLLLSRITRKFAYLTVVIFHLFTAVLFKIGMFPYIMIALTVIFFSGQTHIKIISYLKKILPVNTPTEPSTPTYYTMAAPNKIGIGLLLMVYFSLQLFLPLRYLHYPGKLYWTEEGYRFSWRVMLMEKAGTAFFYVKDPQTGKQTEIINSQYLSSFQETMMCTQPDMILEYAHFLSRHYQKKGIKNPVVTVESYVTLNGSGSRLYIDKHTNLTEVKDSFDHKTWILPFDNKQQ